MRINVTGNAASGKTTLAARIGTELGVPVFSLDSIVWQPNWVKTPPEQRLVEEQRLVALPSWIIDGVSPLVRASADLVVFLDVPRRVCAFRGIRRALHYGFSTRPDLPHPCPEIAIVPHLLKLIYRFHKNGRPQIHLEATKEPHRIRIEQHPVHGEAIIRLIRDLGHRITLPRNPA